MNPLRHSPLSVALAALLLAGCAFVDDLAPIQEALDQAASAPADTVTREQLDSLPAPVARYLERAGVVGRPLLRSVRVEGHGKIRLENGNWVSLTFQQYNTSNPATRHILMESQMAPMLDMEGHDSLDVEGNGRVSIRLNGMPFQESYGPEVDLSELATFLAEVTLLPTLFLSGSVALEELNDRQVRARFQEHGIEVTGVFTFDENDDLVDFVTDDRYRTVGDRQVRQRWSAPCLVYEIHEGVRVCVRAKGIWHEEGKDPFEYADFRMTKVEFDRFELF